MKKTLLKILLCVFTACMFIGCGGTTPPTPDITAPAVFFKFKEYRNVSVANGGYQIKRDEIVVSEEGTTDIKVAFGEEEISLTNDYFAFSKGVGEYEVTVTATDKAGNTTDKSFVVNAKEKDALLLANFETTSEVDTCIANPTQPFTSDIAIVDYYSNPAFGVAEEGQNHALMFSSCFDSQYQHFSIDLGDIYPAGTTLTFDYYVWYVDELVSGATFKACIETATDIATILPAREEIELNTWQEITLTIKKDTRFIELYHNISRLRFYQTAKSYIDNIRFKPVSIGTSAFEYNFTELSTSSVTLTKSDIQKQSKAFVINDGGSTFANLKLVNEGVLTDFNEITIENGSYYALAMCDSEGNRLSDTEITFLGYENANHTVSQDNYLLNGGQKFVSNQVENLPSKDGLVPYSFKIYGMQSTEVPLGFGRDADVYSAGDVITFNYFMYTAGNTDSQLNTASP